MADETEPLRVSQGTSGLSHAGKDSGIVAAVGYAEPMLRVLTTGFGFDGIA